MHAARDSMHALQRPMPRKLGTDEPSMVANEANELADEFNARKLNQIEEQFSPRLESDNGCVHSTDCARD
jgi:hypothetical protein